MVRAEIRFIDDDKPNQADVIYTMDPSNVRDNMRGTDYEFIFKYVVSKPKKERNNANKKY